MNDKYKYYIVCTKKRGEKWNKIIESIDPLIYKMRSMYLYDEQAIEYIDNNGTIKQYDGPKRADCLIVDFDNHGTPIDIFLKKRKQFINFLIFEFPYNFEIWGTKIKLGSKLNKIVEDKNDPSGLHIKIFFENEINPCEDIHLKLKYIVNNLFEQKYLDETIYSNHQMIRIENSLRENKNYGKYLIHKISSRKGLNPTLLTGYTKQSEEKTVENILKHDWHKHGLIKRCLTKPIPVGKQHKWIGTCCTLLKDIGFTKEQATPILLAMLSNCEIRTDRESPLKDGSLEKFLHENY